MHDMLIIYTEQIKTIYMYVEDKLQLWGKFLKLLWLLHYKITSKALYLIFRFSVVDGRLPSWPELCPSVVLAHQVCDLVNCYKESLTLLHLRDRRSMCETWIEFRKSWGQHVDIIFQSFHLSASVIAVLLGLLVSFSGITQFTVSWVQQKCEFIHTFITA